MLRFLSLSAVPSDKTESGGPRGPRNIAASESAASSSSEGSDLPEPINSKTPLVLLSGEMRELITLRLKSGESRETSVWDFIFSNNTNPVLRKRIESARKHPDFNNDVFESALPHIIPAKQLRIFNLTCETATKVYLAKRNEKANDGGFEKKKAQSNKPAVGDGKPETCARKVDSLAGSGDKGTHNGLGEQKSRVKEGDRSNNKSFTETSQPKTVTERERAGLGEQKSRMKEGNRSNNKSFTETSRPKTVHGLGEQKICMTEGRRNKNSATERSQAKTVSEPKRNRLEQARSCMKGGKPKGLGRRKPIKAPQPISPTALVQSRPKGLGKRKNRAEVVHYDGTATEAAAKKQRRSNTPNFAEATVTQESPWQQRTARPPMISPENAQRVPSVLERVTRNLGMTNTVLPDPEVDPPGVDLAKYRDTLESHARRLKETFEHLKMRCRHEWNGMMQQVEGERNQKWRDFIEKHRGRWDDFQDDVSSLMGRLARDFHLTVIKGTCNTVTEKQYAKGARQFLKWRRERWEDAMKRMDKNAQDFFDSDRELQLVEFFEFLNVLEGRFTTFELSEEVLLRHHLEDCVRILLGE